MKWPWSKRPPAPPISAYRPPITQKRAKPSDEGVIVEEIDTSAMTRTGVHKAWKRLTGKSDKP